MSTPTVDDYTHLTTLIVMRDTDAMTQWLDAHITTPADAFHVLFTLASGAGRLSGMALTKGMISDPGDTWALQVGSQATEVQRRAGQIITVALNGDLETLGGLVKAIIPSAVADANEPGVRVYLGVLAEIVGFYRETLEAIRRDQAASTGAAGSGL